MAAATLVCETLFRLRWVASVESSSRLRRACAMSWGKLGLAAVLSAMRRAVASTEPGVGADASFGPSADA